MDLSLAVLPTATKRVFHRGALLLHGGTTVEHFGIGAPDAACSIRLPYSAVQGRVPIKLACAAIWLPCDAEPASGPCLHGLGAAVRRRSRSCQNKHGAHDKKQQAQWPLQVASGFSCAEREADDPKQHHAPGKYQVNPEHTHPHLRRERQVSVWQQRQHRHAPGIAQRDSGLATPTA